MRVQRTRHVSAYVQIPNEIARSSSLTLEALGLLVRLLSMPDANKATVEGITARVPNGRKSVSNAMNTLVEQSYVQRARLQDPETGKWVTLTSVSDHPTDTMPTVGAPTGQAVGGYPKGSIPEGNDLPPEPAEQPSGSEAVSSEEEEFSPEISNDDKPAGKPGDAVIGRAAACLGRLGDHDGRLRLNTSEVLRLAPLAASWLADGFHEMEVLRALTRVLPPSVESAAALVTYRLMNHRPEPAATPLGVPAPRSSVARTACPECHRPYPLGHVGGTCRDCQSGN
ncbi:hypothetical protein ABCR94_23895 [Streptomyces sp. 21So2-11]|uniref:hypothetical protein n=1 Tax=Streptomyces sp. 21So2-11 TaxID=3144408 RepID=UPI003218FBC2